MTEGWKLEPKDGNSEELNHWCLWKPAMSIGRCQFMHRI